MAKHYLRELQHIYNLKILSQYLGKDEYELQNLLYRKTYSSFLIPRKNGKHRSINAPSDELKYVLQNLNRFLSAIYNEMQGQEHPAHGFTLGKGILSNAKIHSGKAFVLNLDLKDFFPSISRNRIKEVFSSEPFMLKTEIADYLSELVTYYDTLPQGSPASPIISNLVCWNLDKTLSDFAKKNLLVYTRYADDLSFSSNQKIDTEIIKQIEDYIQKEGFQLNTDKTRIQNRTERQVVTGVTVNVKPNVSRKFIRRIRAILHSWETLGYEEADTIFQSSYKRRKGVFKAPSLKYYLIGNIAYIGHIRGQDDSIYNNFCIKLFRLSDRKVFKGQIERFIQSLQSDIDNQQFSETNLENRIFNLAKKAFEPHQIRYNNILRKYYTLRKKTKINITKGKNYSSLFLASLETSPEFKELLYESGRFGDKEYYSQYIKEAKRLIRNTNLI
ncbi:MAG: RNA-directed DNA polymerase, partial [Leptospiraceae bacterium]|nr:RNA-directed DNA polymerase [Leptospiraceae bacterium]